ncbi:AraC family transcriptional regulator [Paenibacillus profundus]|uniref:AraC family transcriptional regulator n=1 Tax=Paenibacillus profundus TaxID=1173085 RepID=A0ABS8YFJ2_9BACL|nr:AraC family transcriptional regulator [Paenibacillus profundus]MCE5170758.1 AraC family transcriptional regulator [Paenibacillus profundus]
MIQSPHDLILFSSRDHISFITNKVDTGYHIHNYIQITIGLENDFHITIEEESLRVKGIILDSNTHHKLHGHQEWQCYILVNPESVFGELLKRTYLQDSRYYVLATHQADSLQQLAARTLFSLTGSTEYSEFITTFKQILKLHDSAIEHTLDDRIQDVITCIEKYPIHKLSVKTLSQLIYLSESRLSHLFKEEMGISLVSYILHHKLELAFHYIFGGFTITAAALEAGFNSSSHFTRSVRDKLGMSPRAIIQNSRYLQVKEPGCPYI